MKELKLVKAPISSKEHKITQGKSYEVVCFSENDITEFHFIIKNDDGIHIKCDLRCCEKLAGENWIVVSKEENTSDFKEILDSIGSMLDYKDRNYGNAALQPLDIFARHHGYGSRLDEKLARVKNCEELRKNDVADIIGGLVLICRDKGWNNFDDLKD